MNSRYTFYLKGNEGHEEECNLEIDRVIKEWNH